MGERIQIPDIPEEARTPKVLGLVDIIEQLVQKVRQKEDCAARKLGVSFWQYLTDRISHTYAIRHSLASFSSGLLLTTERPALLRSYQTSKVNSWRIALF